MRELRETNEKLRIAEAALHQKMNSLSLNECYFDFVELCSFVLITF